MLSKKLLPPEIRYQVGRQGSSTWTKPVDDKGLEKILKTRSVSLGTTMRVQERGSTKIGGTVGRLAAIKSLLKRIGKGKVGAFYSLVPSSGSAPAIQVRKVNVKPEIMDTAGTKPVDIMHTAVVDNFPGKFISWGICACRAIAGTSVPSQHSYCNAEDWHGKPHDMQMLANWLVKNAGALNVCNVIYNHRIWNKQNGWHAYTGDNPHVDHVHVDFFPQSPGKSCA